MQEDLRKKLIGRYQQGGSGNTKRHPDATPWGKKWDPPRKNPLDIRGMKDRDKTINYNMRLYGTQLRCPRTKKEVRDAWMGLCRLMNYFSGDAALAARTLQVSRGRIRTMCRRGWVDQFMALRAEETCDTLEWMAPGLASHLYWDAEWTMWRRLYNKPNKRGLRSVYLIPDSGY